MCGAISACTQINLPDSPTKKIYTLNQPWLLNKSSINTSLFLASHPNSHTYIYYVLCENNNNSNIFIHGNTSTYIEINNICITKHDNGEVNLNTTDIILAHFSPLLSSSRLPDVEHLSTSN